MKKHINGFTVIELIFITVLVGAASIIFFIQKSNIEAIAKDDTKKMSINAMYYSLEEVFYPANKYYPQTISTDNLKSVDPDLFTDPDGIQLGDSGSAYIYSPTDCNNNQCKSYTLRATLQNENEFTKTSRHN